MSEPRERIAAAIKNELERQGVLYSADADDRAYLATFAMNTGVYANLDDLVSVILAIPGLEDARRLPGAWPDDTDYGRGWNDCRRHAWHWATPEAEVR